jgi:enoyl-CoA hydratase/carnithine racemase
MIDIVLDSPGKNALGTALMSSLREQLRKANGEPVLLRGAGDALSAGLDLREVVSLDTDGMRRFLGLLDDLVLDLYTYTGPTVALVNGHAIAGGCVLALCCDVRIAQRNPRVRIGLNEVALGVRFPPRVMALVRDRIPRRFLELVLLGAELYPPERAAELGLVDETCDDAERVARERLAALARHPASAYRAAKQRLRAGVFDQAPEEHMRFEREDLPAWTTEAVRSQIRAVLERR